MLGTPLALPFLLAPVGSSRMFYPRGEEVAARAAGDGRDGLHPVDALGLPARGREARDDGSGVVPALSRRRTRRRTRAIARARKAGYSALVVTIDTPVAGMRERDLRNGTKELLTRNPLDDAARSSGSSPRGRAGSPGSSATAG